MLNSVCFVTTSPIHQGTGYCFQSISLVIYIFVYIVLCFFVSKITRKRGPLDAAMLISLSATLRANCWTDLHEIFMEGVEWPWHDLITFFANSEKPWLPRDAAMRNTGTGFVVLMHHSLFLIVLCVLLYVLFAVQNHSLDNVKKSCNILSIFLVRWLNVSLVLKFVFRRMLWWKRLRRARSQCWCLRLMGKLKDLGCWQSEHPVFPVHKMNVHDVSKVANFSHNFSWNMQNVDKFWNTT